MRFSGIHYVGRMQEGSLTRFMLDQLTEGQLEWARLPHVYDTIILGEPGSAKTYRIYSGKREFYQGLKEQFPGEDAAIDEFQRLVQVKGDAGRGCGGFWLCGVVWGGEIPPYTHSPALGNCRE